MKISVTIFIFFGLYFINAQEKVILKGMTKQEIKTLTKHEKEKDQTEDKEENNQQEQDPRKNRKKRRRK